MRAKYISILFVSLLFSGIKIVTFPQTIPTDIENLSVGADVILTGKVTKQNSSWNKDKTKIFTDVTIEVDEYLKGNRGDKSLVVTTLGGEVGEVGELYSHMPRFSKDEEVLLFVKKDNKSMNYKVLNGEEGKINVITDPITGKKITSSNMSINSLKAQIKNYVND